MISDSDLDAMLGRAVVASICTPTAMPSSTDDVNVLIAEVRRLRTALADLIAFNDPSVPDVVRYGVANAAARASLGDGAEHTQEGT